MKLKLNKVSIQREPLFSLKAYQEIPISKKKLSRFIDSLRANNHFAEAVFLASPDLHKEWFKIEGNQKDRERIDSSVLKYYLRSISNTVPFGLFTSYGIDQRSSMDGSYDRFSNIDMEYLYRVVQNLSSHSTIQEISKYKVNNTLYEVDNNLRYIDPSFENGNLAYTLSSLKNDELLTFLKGFSQRAMTKGQIQNLILETVDGVDESAVEDYVLQLINSNFYISDFQLSLNKQDLLEQILVFYKKNSTAIDRDSELKQIFGYLGKVQLKLKALDKRVFNSKDSYEEIFKLLDKIGYSYNKKYVVNSNLKHKVQQITQGNNDKLKDTVGILNTIASSKIERKTIINEFRKNFYKRYENQEIPLLTALDNELGIGYKTNLRDRAIYSDLLDDIQLQGKQRSVKEIQIETDVFNFWMRLIQKQQTIDLKNENLNVFPEKDNIRNGSFPVSYNLVDDKIYLKSAGGFSGTNLLGRFSNNDDEVSELINDVSRHEQEVFKDMIPAEILHLPMTRAGNILIRKINRPAEINLLSKPSGEAEAIDINDLMVSLKGNRIILRSKKHQKEIIPFLTSAQNFHLNSLPIYQFLCDLQAQYRFSNLSINFGGLPVESFTYIPRITYGSEIVLRRATWILHKDKITSPSKLRSKLEQLEVPRFVNITEGFEDKMIIDVENENTLDILFNQLSKRKEITLTECIYDMNSDEKAREYISIFESSKDKSFEKVQFKDMDSDSPVSRSFTYGDEWIYFKIYTGRITANDVLLNYIQKIAKNLSDAGVIDKWFFLRFTDPDFHLRVRFHLTDSKNFNAISAQVKEVLSGLIDEGKISGLDLSTYTRELERYGYDNIENTEKLFHIDSQFTVDLMQEMKSDELHKSWFYIIKSIDDYFTVFNISLEDKLALMSRMYKSFWKEHGSPKSVKKAIEHKFRNHSKAIDELLDRVPGHLEKVYIQRFVDMEAIDFPSKDASYITNLLWSYIHMHVNRFMLSSPRFHEMVLYGILEKQYKKEVGKKKYMQKA